MKAKTRSAVSATIGVFCLFFTASAFAAAKHVTLSCGGYTGTTTLTNFQALVKLTEGVGGFSYSDCAANGTDLWFTDASGTTVYPHEIDTWNTSGESFVWVRLPEVLPTSGGLRTTFAMHWGDAAEKAAHPCTTTDTWSGLLGVWHMNGIVENDVPQTEPDASGNGLDATPVGYNNNTTDIRQMGRAATAVVGHARVNKNVTNKTNTNLLKVPKYTDKLTDGQKYTLGGWFRRTGNGNGTSGDYTRLFSNQGTFTLVSGNDPLNSDANIDVFRNANASPIVFNSITTSNSDWSWPSDWVYLVFVSDGTTQFIYKDGGLLKSTGNAAATVHIDSYGLTIGGRGWRTGNSLNGEYDEVRFYNGAISADRVKADYDTMSAPDTFLTFLEARETTLRATGYAGTATLTNFQALVKISESAGGFSYSQCSANYGADLWFTDSAGNVIPHEVDTWNSSGDSLVWVRLPELSPVSQGATSFTMHWGDLAAKQTTSVNVWKNYNDGKGGFAGVWHMGTASGTANEPDASGNGLDAVPTVNYGTGDLTVMTTTPGIVGNGRVNQTAESYVQGLKVPDYSSHVTDASKFTISGWWTATALNTYPRFASAEGVNNYWAIVGYNNDGGSINRWKKIQGVYSNGEVKNGGSTTSAFAVDSFRNSEGNWVYLTVVWDGTTLTAYSNGAQKYQKTTMVAQTALDSGFMIGGDSAAASKNPAWRGYYDEVRMYDGAQNADRIKADYDTMSDPDTFVTYTTIATWTGAANDGNGANPLNWECSNNGVVVVGQLPNATYRIQSCTLSRDCDWSGLGTVYLAKGAVIEMDGHSLTLPAVAGEGTVQNSAAGDAKELTISVPSNWTNADVSFSGNLKLVKTGTGTFTSSKAQTYSGGTIVAAGTARPPTRTSASDVTYSWGSFKAFGPGEITVLPNATFDVRGQYGYCEIITLAGGTYASSGFTGMDDTRTDQSGVWRLTADSSANITQSLMFGNAGNDHLFNLNGHTFTVNVSGREVYFNSVFSYADNPGTMVLKGEGFGISISDYATIWATTVTFRVSTRVNLSKNVKFHMLDYIAEHTVNVLYAKEGSQLYVYGTFKPNTANSYFVGPQIQDGATVDLSEMTGPWSVKSGGANLTTCKYVTFANGATVNVNLGSRKVSTSEAIMTWDAESKPANLATLTFKGVFNDRTVTLSKGEDGLYMPRGLIISVQ